ncbi:DUF3857 and transglutaminase domain-containing protein [Hymenobacter tibetensis]|uniref:DUF3857 and transglutaminase domain-containing protein n=1 Tax=Hymenobacter tibetensis TaxID=497967 RepID=A0ABY4D029_9BACT|nr:DUF3857 and transglutaminase domain-containing protein [Hymenobacter tibetensis]UOG75889.1 DUF3857 and transglutaminase domain-containing protein [Hymenobacter tibetensis]
MLTPVLRQLALLVVLGGVATLPALGQVDPIKFGKPNPEDFLASNFVADSAAEAVVLCDYGRSRFEYIDGDFRVIFDRVTRIKILSKGGYDWATVEVPLYHQNSREEKLTNVRGFTYNLVGKEVTKEKFDATIFREEASSNVTMRKFTLPKVREGSVIEYAYTVVSDFTFNFQDWQFQQTIPVRWSEYRASIPTYFDYKILMQGYEAPTVAEHSEGAMQVTVREGGSFEGGGFNTQRVAASSSTVNVPLKTHRWAIKDVPAFRDEPFMTSSRDYISRIDFELAGIRWEGQPYRAVADSWEKINTDLLADENFGQQLKRGSFLKEQLTPLLAKEKDPAARVAAIHALVRKAVKYDGYDRLYSTSSIRKAYDQHRGTAADVNLLLIAALREAGFQANPVLLSTRNHGIVNQEFMPLLSRFNYVVAHVALPEGKEMLADATEELVPCGMLPTRCLNTTGRLIMPKAADSRWISLTPQQRLTEYHNVQLTLDEKGGYTGKVHSEHSGYAGLRQRGQLSEKGEKKFVEELLKGREGWNIGKYQFNQRDVLDKPLGLDYELTSAGGDAAASMLYLKPLQHFGNTRNPFVHEDRKFPVDFGCALDETLVMTLTLPAGYEVEELPKPTSVALPDNGGRFMFQAQPLGSTIQITSRLSLARPVYSAEEYASLREFYRLVVAKQTEQLVLKKKS